MEKSAELMDSGYAILDWSTDLMRFPKKLSESAGLPPNYKRMPLHAFMIRVHATLPGEDPLSLAANHMHWDFIFVSAIPDQDCCEQEEGILLYRSTLTLPVDHMENLET